MEAVKAAFPKVAFGKLGLVLAEGRSPRLVVDSSISGVTSSCVIPNRLLNPRISDLQACAPISLASEEWIVVSLDVRKAHRQVMISPLNQGLLSFTFQGRVFVSRTLNFGAKASSWWWGRIAGALLRLSHKLVWVAHLMFAYVDDYFGVFRADTAPVYAGLWILLFLALRVPLSWSKASWGPCARWIGWDIDLRSWTVSLPPEKLSKILEPLRALARPGATRIKVKELESLIGRLLWLTSLWRLLRPLLAPLYKIMARIPSSCVAVQPSLWQSICALVDDDCVLTRATSHASFPARARISRVANRQVLTKTDLVGHPFLKRRLWVEVRMPDHPFREINDDARKAAESWMALLADTPFIFSLRSPPVLPLVAEADAFADDLGCGLGGYVTWPSGVSRWFSLHWSASVAAEHLPLFSAPLQAHISALELLAQLLLLWCIHDTLPSCRGPLRVCLRSDNSGAEAVAEKGLSSVPALAAVLSCFMCFQRWSGLCADIEHIPGYRNDLADELSRLKGGLSPLPLADRCQPPVAHLLRPQGRALLFPPGSHWPAAFRAFAD